MPVAASDRLYFSTALFSVYNLGKILAGNVLYLSLAFNRDVRGFDLEMPVMKLAWATMNNEF